MTEILKYADERVISFRKNLNSAEKSAGVKVFSGLNFR
jgi:hypothetical protein